MGNDLEMESLHKSAFSCNFTIGHPMTLKDVYFYHSINYPFFSLSCFYCNKSEGQQKMKDMNLYAKSKKITISNGTTHTHDIISYLPFQAELLIWKANISDCDEDKKGYSNI